MSILKVYRLERSCLNIHIVRYRLIWFGCIEKTHIEKYTSRNLGIRMGHLLLFSQKNKKSYLTSLCHFQTSMTKYLTTISIYKYVHALTLLKQGENMSNITEKITIKNQPLTQTTNWRDIKN